MEQRRKSVNSLWDWWIQSKTSCSPSKLVLLFSKLPSTWFQTWHLGGWLHFWHTYLSERQGRKERDEARKERQGQKIHAWVRSNLAARVVLWGRTCFLQTTLHLNKTKRNKTSNFPNKTQKNFSSFLFKMSSQITPSTCHGSRCETSPDFRNISFLRGKITKKTNWVFKMLLIAIVSLLDLLSK